MTTNNEKQKNRKSFTTTGIAGAVLFGSVIGLAAIFPQRFTGAVMMGNGIAGVVVMVMRIVTKFAIPDDEFASALAFFVLAALVLLVCIALFVWLLRLPITRNYDADFKASKRRGAPTSDRQPLLDPTKNDSSRHVNETINVVDEVDHSGKVGASAAASAEAGVTTDVAPPPVYDDLVVNADGTIKVSMWRTFLRVKMACFSVFTTFLITLTLFPGYILIA